MLTTTDTKLHLKYVDLCIMTRSSATAEKQCTEHRRITEVVLFLTYKRSSVGRKWILTSNCHSRSFKVIHFEISYRPTRGSMSPYNTAGLISEDSEEVATEIAKNCRRRQPHSQLTPPPRGTPNPTNIPINLIFLETRIIGLHFCH